MPSPFLPQQNPTHPIPYNVPPARGYSHITATPSINTTAGNRLISIAGQTGLSPSSSTPSTSLASQAETAFYNLLQCLAASGATISDLLSMRIYIVDYDPSLKKQPWHRALASFLDEKAPPSITVVPVPTLVGVGVVFEVEAMASIPVEPVREVEVVVVGAGLSGLQAAWDLQKAGVGVVMVEARGRVGGKTWSRDTTPPKRDGEGGECEGGCGCCVD